MKILLIDTFEFLTKYNKINGIFTFDQAKILNKSNYNVDILSPGVFSVKDLFKKKYTKNLKK